jgi:GNAT superfamily N-acetyltransferase
MVVVRRAESDADFESVRRVRLAVVPHERALTVAEMRAAAGPDTVHLLAERDGAVLGSGLADRSDLAGAAVVIARVLPEFRRQGVGTELFGELLGYAATLGVEHVVSHADDEGSRAFTERFGFVEVDRQVEQIRSIGAEPPAGPPDGVDFVTVAQRPELWDIAYERVGRQAFVDMALTAPVQVSLEQWRSEWIGAPEAMILALSGGEIIGLAGLMADADHPERAENALTAVRREWRGKGVAAALKRSTLAWAAAHGIREVYTWTQKGNADMRRLNEHLGYQTRLQSFTMRAPLKG